jgi:Iap family predicted aminopeptidase
MPCSACKPLVPDGLSEEVPITAPEELERLRLAAASCSECSLIDKVVRAGAPEDGVQVRMIAAHHHGHFTGRPDPFFGLAVWYWIDDGAIPGRGLRVESHLYLYAARGERGHRDQISDTGRLT